MWWFGRWVSLKNQTRCNQSRHDWRAGSRTLLFGQGFGWWSCDALKSVEGSKNAAAQFPLSITGATTNITGATTLGSTLWVTWAATFSSTIQANGKVTINAWANGLQYTDGNQAAGKVLQSDASGNASWQTPSALSFPLPSKGNSWNPNASTSTNNSSAVSSSLQLPSGGIIYNFTLTCYVSTNGPTGDAWNASLQYSTDNATWNNAITYDCWQYSIVNFGGSSGNAGALMNYTNFQFPINMVLSSWYYWRIKVITNNISAYSHYVYGTASIGY